MCESALLLRELVRVRRTGAHRDRMAGGKATLYLSGLERS